MIDKSNCTSATIVAIYKSTRLLGLSSPDYTCELPETILKNIHYANLRQTTPLISSSGPSMPYLIFIHSLTIHELRLTNRFRLIASKVKPSSLLHAFLCSNP
jgi:hypothetical protein